MRAGRTSDSDVSTLLLPHSFLTSFFLLFAKILISLPQGFKIVQLDTSDEWDLVYYNFSNNLFVVNTFCSFFFFFFLNVAPNWYTTFCGHYTFY